MIMSRALNLHVLDSKLCLYLGAGCIGPKTMIMSRAFNLHVLDSKLCLYLGAGCIGP